MLRPPPLVCTVADEKRFEQVCAGTGTGASPSEGRPSSVGRWAPRSPRIPWQGAYPSSFCAAHRCAGTRSILLGGCRIDALWYLTQWGWQVVPISLRISLDDLKGLKKRVITELRARESKEMTEAELTMDMLNHAVSLGVLGVVRHKLNFNGTLHDLAVSSHTIHMVRSQLRPSVPLPIALFICLKTVASCDLASLRAQRSSVSRLCSLHWLCALRTGKYG